jgi:hypothetical protein
LSALASIRLESRFHQVARAYIQFRGIVGMNFYMEWYTTRPVERKHGNSYVGGFGCRRRYPRRSIHL